MKNVIITGADGFVGSYTVSCFLSHDVSVLALDINEKPHRLKENVRLTYMRCDVSNSNEMLSNIKHYKYDTFIHFAWVGSAGADRTDFKLQIENALSTVECMKTAKKLGCSRFVCAGSIMEYEAEVAIRTQGYHVGLNNVYGVGKHIAHCMCKASAEQIGIELVWPVITNAYGVGELSPRFINTTLRKIINNETLQFTAGTQNYDFVYITDVAEAFYYISLKGKPYCEYIIGSGNARPLKEFIQELLQSCAPNSEVVFGDIPYSGTNLPLSAYSVERTREDTGFTPKVGFAEGTVRTKEWLTTLRSDE